MSLTAPPLKKTQPSAKKKDCLTGKKNVNSIEWFPMKSLIFLDRLALVMMALVSFVGLSVASFSSRYLRGDRRQGRFYLHLAALLLSLGLLVSADHLLLFFVTWAVSNLLLVRLMLHKPEWRAARESSWLALKNFSLGFLFLAGAFLILYEISGETSIQAILRGDVGAKRFLFAAGLIFLSAMTQSALWPFHRWLTSSLNSPTPVSAIMHAGLVNGGGFLLARFAPLFLRQPAVLNAMFLMGVATALLGTLWKLMQSDIKRMLACSTMGQMGFMMAQCGLGLFPAAIAHLCWHGLFKAYLFLSSGSAAQEKRLDLEGPPRTGHFFLALACGAAAAALFSLVSGKELLTWDVHLFLVALALVAGTPAKRIGWVGQAGARLEPTDASGIEWVCPKTGAKYKSTAEDTLEEMS